MLARRAVKGKVALLLGRVFVCRLVVVSAPRTLSYQCQRYTSRHRARPLRRRAFTGGPRVEFDYNTRRAARIRRGHLHPVRHERGAPALVGHAKRA